MIVFRGASARATEALPARARALIEENRMQSINSGNRYKSTNETASTAGRREAIRTAPQSAMAGGAGFAILLMLFLASTAYVVFGGTYELASSPEAAISVAAAVLEPADGSGAARTHHAYGSSAEPTDYFPAGYVERGRYGEGNAMTFERN
jgi:hypothetical protein